MTEQEKLPKKLPILTDEESLFQVYGLSSQGQLRSEIERVIQRNADQLLYSALWEENKRLNEALTLSLAETAKWAYEAGLLMAAQMVEHRDSTKQGGA